jgi:WD repeat-containing protein 70
MAREKTRPENPHLIHGHGKGTRISTNLTQHIMKTKMKDTSRIKDPREAILKFAEEAKNDPYWVAPAYKKAGQKLADKVYEDENEAAQEEKRRRRK